MALLTKLHANIILHILEEWLTCIDKTRVDSSFCSTKFRNIYLHLLRTTIKNIDANHGKNGRGETDWILKRCTGSQYSYWLWIFRSLRAISTHIIKADKINTVGDSFIINYRNKIKCWMLPQSVEPFSIKLSKFTANKVCSWWCTIPWFKYYSITHNYKNNGRQLQPINHFTHECIRGRRFLVVFVTSMSTNGDLQFHNMQQQQTQQ